MGGENIRVLHVDDESSFADLTARFLERGNDQFSIETAASAEEGLEIISDRLPDCVVSDYNMPGMDGLEFLQTVRTEHPDLPFVLFTGKGSEEVASETVAGDVTDYLQKGSGSEQYELLVNRIQNAVRARRVAGGEHVLVSDTSCVERAWSVATIFCSLELTFRVCQRLQSSHGS